MSVHQLSAREKQILLLIRQGHNTMVELMDVTALGGEVVNSAVEILDQNRFIEREGFIGGKFWSFVLTAKGMDALPAMNELEETLYRRGLWPTDLETLRFFQQAGTVIASEHIYSKVSAREKQLSLAASLIKLLRLGYMREFGFTRRKVEVNEKGTQLLAEFNDKSAA